MTNAYGKIIANVERLHRLMDEEGISAIVARSGKNFTYLAGFAYPGTLARHLEFPDSPREVLLVWPRTGEPVMALNSYAAPLARRDSWLERIEIVDDYAESPYERTADVLRQLGLAEETIGFEKSYVSADRWEEIGELLPRARIVDSTELMDRVRWIKTPAEVAALEAGARLLDEAYLEVLPEVRPGDTERLVHSRIIESCLRRGANWAHGILNSSRNTVAYGGESDLAFEAGDIIRNDYVSYLNGYPGHQSRSVCVGAPSDEQKRIYQVTRDIYRATIERCRPGARDGGHLPPSPTTASTKPDSRATLPWPGMASAPGGTSRNRTWCRPARASWRRAWWWPSNRTSATGTCRTWCWSPATPPGCCRLSSAPTRCW